MQPASGASGQTWVRGSRAPLGFTLWLSRPIKASVITKISLLDGWGLRAGMPGSGVGQQGLRLWGRVAGVRDPGWKDPS